MPWLESYSYLGGPLVALLGMGVFVGILRWAFSSKRTSLVARPGQSGSADSYGMLVVVTAPDTFIEAEIERLKLRDAGIKATVANTTDGPRLMVFPGDLGRAAKVLRRSAGT